MKTIVNNFKKLSHPSRVPAALARRFRKWLNPSPAPAPIASPVIKPHLFHRGYPQLYTRKTRQQDSRSLGSQLCRFDTLNSPTFRAWAEKIREPWRAHRKLWELAFICQALDERQMLQAGRRGLGFAIGAEKLPSFFASLGCEITATDLPSDDERNKPWAASGQWVGNLEALNAAGLCEEHEFRKRVTFRPVDMNHIPADLRDFDFTWSTCSFEHCGSLELGLTFLQRQMDCLRPGGVAVHTTEFNLSSNDATLLDAATVIYRLRDIEAICDTLSRQGHQVEPIDVDPGRHPMDWFIDEPPYSQWATDPPPKIKHLRLNLAGYASTSIAIIARKAAQGVVSDGKKSTQLRREERNGNQT
jgi:hypothetical protein